MFDYILLAVCAALVHRNHVAESKYTSIGGMGMGGMDMGGMGMGGMGMGGMGMGSMGMGGMGMGGLGGSSIDQSQFNEAEKKFNDLFFKKAQGSEGGQFGLGQSGFQKGEGMNKVMKGEGGSFSGFNGGKKMHENGQGYQGGQKFNKEGKKGGAKKLNQGHKKGHTIKGYHSSNQKDENTKTEEFYDEEHDEAGKVAFAGEKGEFAEKKDAAVKGEKADKEYKAAQEKKGGAYAKKYLDDKEKMALGKYGKKKYAGDQAGYKLNAGGDVNAMGGHEEAKKFYKHYPVHY